MNFSSLTVILVKTTGCLNAGLKTMTTYTLESHTDVQNIKVKTEAQYDKIVSVLFYKTLIPVN